MSEHTKGPWVVVDCRTANDPYISIVAVRPARVIASIRNKGSKQLLSNEDVANARLIAALPQLLEACKRQLANIERWLETGIPADADESKSIYEELKAAVKAAEGGECSTTSPV